MKNIGRTHQCIIAIIQRKGVKVPYFVLFVLSLSLKLRHIPLLYQHILVMCRHIASILQNYVLMCCYNSLMYRHIGLLCHYNTLKGCYNSFMCCNISMKYRHIGIMCYHFITMCRRIMEALRRVFLTAPHVCILHQYVVNVLLAKNSKGVSMPLHIYKYG